MAKVLPTVTIGGVPYSVLRLRSSSRGPAYLLRASNGEVFGLFREGHRPSYLYPVRIQPGLYAEELLAFEFLEVEGRLVVRDGERKAGRR